MTLQNMILIASTNKKCLPITPWHRAWHAQHDKCPPTDGASPYAPPDMPRRRPTEMAGM